MSEGKERVEKTKEKLSAGAAAREGHQRMDGPLVGAEVGGHIQVILFS